MYAHMCPRALCAYTRARNEFDRAAAGKEAMARFIQVPHVQRVQRVGEDPPLSGRQRCEDTRRRRHTEGYDLHHGI